MNRLYVCLRFCAGFILGVLLGTSMLALFLGAIYADDPGVAFACVLGCALLMFFSWPITQHKE